MISVYPWFFIFALLYSMVGLGGGSAYSALLGISGIDHNLIPSTALFLNLVVTSLGFYNFRVHVDFQRKKKFLALLYGSAMLGVLLGSKVNLSRQLFYLILGISLIAASAISFLRDVLVKQREDAHTSMGNLFVLPLSFVFGGLAGLVGIGGGVFLAPVLLLAGLPAKEIAGITSLYILFNSSVGFLSHLVEGNVDFRVLLPLSFLVLLGGFVGSTLGAHKVNPVLIKRLLTLIILIIGGRILWIGIS